MAGRRRFKVARPVNHPNLRAGDKVLVIAGKDRGKEGTVERTLPRKGLIVVKGINLAKRHTKASAKVTQGGIVDFDAPLAYSNVQLVCPSCNKPTRIRKKVLTEKGPGGQPVTTNVCVNCGETIERTKE
jgi:large subunit ribosomal protein L24